MLEKIAEWTRKQGLAIAPEKTEAVLLIGRKQHRPITFKCLGQVVEPKTQIKYLGVVFDHRLSFRQHVVETARKASGRASALSRLLPIINGPGSSKRRLLSQVVVSTMTYGSSIWCRALEHSHNRNLLAGVQRKMALRVTRAYRTVSTSAARALAGMTPIELQIAERERVDTGSLSRAEATENTWKEWQRLWDETDGWTHQLIPLIREWTERQHGELSYHLTQLLSGHGAFGHYLHKIGKRDTPNCVQCGDNDDTAEHVLVHCPAWTLPAANYRARNQAVQCPQNPSSKPGALERHGEVCHRSNVRKRPGVRPPKGRRLMQVT